MHWVKQDQQTSDYLYDMKSTICNKLTPLHNLQNKTKHVDFFTRSYKTDHKKALVVRLQKSQHKYIAPKRFSELETLQNNS